MAKHGLGVVRSLNEQYYRMRLSGYKVEELWCVIFDNYVFLCNGVQLEAMKNNCPSEVVRSELEEFSKVESRVGILRVMDNQKDYMEIGWIKPPREVEEMIEKDRELPQFTTWKKEVVKC